MKRRFLKPTTFPSVFPGLATHYQKEVPAQRSDETSSSARRSRAAERQEALADDFLAADKVTKIKIRRTKLEEGLNKPAKYLPLVSRVIGRVPPFLLFFLINKIR